MPPRIREPFGLVTQAELAYLREIGADAAHVGLLVVLRARVDRSTGTVSDTLATIARWSLIHGGALKQRLAWLEEKGIVRREGRAAVDGARGHWGQRRRPLTLEDWPNIRPQAGQSSEPTSALLRADVRRNNGPGDANYGPQTSNNGPLARGTIQSPRDLPDDPSFVRPRTPEHVLRRMDPVEAERVRAFEARRT